MCLGFWLPQNFRYPYAAIGFSDFWRRWHITLSAWLRDYLYIPLGGNRKGEFRTYLSLMITMLLGGLWHGASWTFVVWGALHGIYLSVERMLRPRGISSEDLQAGERVPTVTVIEPHITKQASLAPAFFQKKSVKNFMLALLTFFLVNVTWVFFRATDFTTAWRLLGSMFGGTKEGIAILPTIGIYKVAIVVTLMFFSHWFLRNTSVLQVAQKMKWWAVSLVWAFMLILLILSQESSGSFIYFQF